MPRVPTTIAEAVTCDGVGVLVAGIGQAVELGQETLLGVRSHAARWAHVPATRARSLDGRARP